MPQLSSALPPTPTPAANPSPHSRPGMHELRPAHLLHRPLQYALSNGYPIHDVGLARQVGAGGLAHPQGLQQQQQRQRQRQRQCL